VLGTTDPFTTFVGTLSFWVGAVASIAAAYMMVASIKNLIRAALALTTTVPAAASAPPDSDYLVFVASEGNDRIALVRFGPGSKGLMAAEIHPESGGAALASH